MVEKVSSKNKSKIYKVAIIIIIIKNNSRLE